MHCPCCARPVSRVLQVAIDDVHITVEDHYCPECGWMFAEELLDREGDSIHEFPLACPRHGVLSVEPLVEQRRANGL